MAFWNDNYAEEISLEGIDSSNFKDLAPSEKQFEGLKRLSSCPSILDYGCGHGWGAIILAKLGAKRVKGVDLSPNAVKMASSLSKAYSVKAEFASIEEDYLFQTEERFDGVFCSNVIDVVPLEVAKSIVEGLANVLKQNGKALISLNHYVKPTDSPEREKEAKDGCLYVNGILRLLCLSDEEWSRIFEKHFEILSLDHYAWPGEEEEKRRLFFLRRK